MNFAPERPEALAEESGEIHVVSPVKARIKGRNETEWSPEVPVDTLLDSADPADFAALLLPS